MYLKMLVNNRVVAPLNLCSKHEHTSSKKEERTEQVNEAADNSLITVRSF